ncbi:MULTISPECIES: DUF4189 domain-containing protein [Xanthomonas]|uniref:DUF4189 domain-containing protein n=1 Tax=Xanthomonas TaxID=338 RepID=UPI0009BA5A84|nr:MULTISPECIES: DUF4189 domain-containing protein [Xanthomonas]ATS87133.1 DUF4189 domain-containing protein [Xanthomonas citri pv. phaseoli var. fuscans]MCC8470428.1 DUF4189 domain-containing protein [Xanthomonas phaseoli]QWN04608.1 DUF4189 domain-containing protein [Xanthomonas citri pv. fuscans]
MKFGWALIFSALCAAGTAKAEQGCPPGQYPIGGQGVAACAPIPQENSTEQQSRPSGKWIKTWGAIAMGSVDSIFSYGVTTGKLSKSEAEKDALNRCASHGEKNCKIGLAYKNQCAAIAEPKVNGKPFSTGLSNFVGAGTTAEASNVALERCKADNRPTPGVECKIIYEACSEPIFKAY